MLLNGFLILLTLAMPRLLAADTNLNAIDKNGWTALHWAVSNNQLADLKNLLSKGVDPDIRNEHGWTAIYLAASLERLDVLKLLLKMGADPNVKVDGHTVLYLTVKEFMADTSSQSKLNLIETLLSEKANPNIKSDTGYAPLHWAVTHEGLLSLLLNVKTLI